MDKFSSMTELLGKVNAQENYEIYADRAYRSKVKLFAPHAGCIEPCTGEIVHALASDQFDCFVFRGIRKKECFKTLHVTSTHYDEPQCLGMVREAELAIAFHGCDGEESFLQLGGGSAAFSSHLSTLLKDSGYKVVPVAQNLRGEDERNFINQAHKKGIQVECSAGFRRNLFPGFPKTLQRHPTEFPRFISLLREWLEIVQAELIQPRA